MWVLRGGRAVSYERGTPVGGWTPEARRGRVYRSNERMAACGRTGERERERESERERKSQRERARERERRRERECENARESERKIERERARVRERERAQERERARESASEREREHTQGAVDDAVGQTAQWTSQIGPFIFVVVTMNCSV